MIASATFADSALPGLATALDPAAVSPLLGSLLGTEGERRPRVTAVDVLKHKPGRRCSLAFSLEGPGGRGKVFGKTFANDRGAGIFLVMGRAARSVSQAEMLIPRPLGYLPELKLLVTEYLEGIPLAPLLYDADPREAARRIARAIAALHRSRATVARRWSCQREQLNTADWLRALSLRMPEQSARARRLLRELRGRAESFLPAPECLIHRDFYAEQVWDCQGRLALLDLDDACCGDSATDIGNFLAHLTLRPLQFSGTAAGCEQARPVFLETYRYHQAEHLPNDGMSERIRFYEAASLLRLAGVYSTRDRWAGSLPPLLLSACERVFESG